MSQKCTIEYMIEIHPGDESTKKKMMRTLIPWPLCSRLQKIDSVHYGTMVHHCISGK
jgi:hypothetical protein